MSRYRIPKKRARAEIKVSNSRFIATVGPAFSVKEAQGLVREIREEMPDAHHHVYAFKVGFGASVSEGMSDDGEPSGTAGPPALSVVRGSNVGDVAVVITRYYGGTKLGTGGLVAAYTKAAQVAFEALETEEKISRTAYEVAAPYALLESLRRLFEEFECVVETEEFTADVRWRFLIPEERADAFVQAVKDLSAGKVVPTAL